MSQTSNTSSQPGDNKPGLWTMTKAAIAAKLMASPDVRYTVQNITPLVWFSPVNPLAPLADKPEQAAIGRKFDYPVGYNLQIIPRAYEAISFGQLRQLADAYDILRLLIENKKDIIAQADWHIVPNDDVVPKKDQPKMMKDPRIAEMRAFFNKPDGVNNFRTWIRALCEDMLVIDATTIYPRLTVGGDLIGLDLIDGATIKPVIDAYGRRPADPDVAYQQIIKGIPSVDYTARELIYRPRNIRTNRVYGYSPVEQVLVTVNIALRRQLYQLEYYKDGSIPDTLFAMPDGWTPDQLAQFELMFNTMLGGNLAGRRQAKFVPKDTKLLNTREATLKDEYDEWLARVCCFAFSTNPQPFIKMMNRATAQTMKETADEEGVGPYVATIEDMLTDIMHEYKGYTDLRFKFKPLSELDPLKRAQSDQIDVTTGIKSIDQVLIERNMAPIGMGNAIITPTGPIMLEPFIKGTVTGVPSLDSPEPEPTEPTSGPSGVPAPTPAPSKKPTKGPGKVKKAQTEAEKVIKMAMAAARLGGKSGSDS
jgi:hypothetical protein